MNENKAQAVPNAMALPSSVMRIVCAAFGPLTAYRTRIFSKGARVCGMYKLRPTFALVDPLGGALRPATSQFVAPHINKVPT